MDIDFDKNKKNSNNIVYQLFNNVKAVTNGINNNVTNLGNESFGYDDPNVKDSVQQLDNSIKNSLVQLSAVNEMFKIDDNKLAIVEEAVKNTYINTYSAKRFTDHLQRLSTQRAPTGDGYRSISTENINFSPSQITNTELSKYVTNSMSSANEAWDGQNFETALTYNIVLNYTATEQDEFCKAFFPIIPIKASDAFFEINSNQIYIMNNEPTHDINGNPSRSKFKRQSVIKSALDPETWSTNRNLLIPVVRTESAKFFLTDYKTMNTETGVTIETAPLVADETINLTGIAHDDQLAAKGTPNYTDAIDRDVVIKNIYLEVKDSTGNKTSIFRIPVRKFRTSRFLPTVQGDREKSMTLNFVCDSIYLDVSTSKDASGKTSEVLESLVGTMPNYKIQLSISAGGNIDTEMGDITVSTLGKGTVVRLYDEKGEVVPDSDAKYTTVNNTIGSIKIAGYDLVAYRTNSNLRVQGKMLKSDLSKTFYTVPFHTAVTISGPVTNSFGDDNDINRLVSCLGIGNLAIRHDAVYQMQEFASTLRSITEFTIGSMKPKLDTIAEHYIDLYYEFKSLDLTTLVDGISSTDRLSDIRSAFLNNIFQDVNTMGLASKYFNAFDAFFPGDRRKMHVLVGTDPIIAAYLRGGKSGDDLKFDSDKYLDIVASYDPRMYGKIYVTFSVYDTLEGGKHSPHPLAFGWCPWAPATVVDINRTIDGATSKTLFSFLRFANITNLPIMLEYNVTGIEEVLGKVQVYTKEIADNTTPLPGPGGATTTTNTIPSASAGAVNYDGDD